MPVSASPKVDKTEQGMTVAGSIVFANIVSLLEQSRDIIETYQENSIIIDFTLMKRIDSAGIALLLEWQRRAKNINKNCHFLNMTAQAQSLIDAYELKSQIAA